MSYLDELEKLVPPSQDEGDTMLVLTGIQFGKKRLAAMIALAQAAPALLKVVRAAASLRDCKRDESQAMWNVLEDALAELKCST